MRRELLRLLAVKPQDYCDRFTFLNLAVWIVTDALSVMADGLFSSRLTTAPVPEGSEIDRMIPIVAEIEQVAYRQNLSLNSRAQISDGSGRRSLLVRRKNLR